MVAARLHADVFLPKFGMGVDEARHNLNTFVILKDGYLNAIAAHVILGAEEILVLANDDARDFVEHHGAAAHRTGREGGVDAAVLIDASGQAAGIAQAVHLSVIDGTAGLHAAVMTSADDLAVVHQDGSDRDAAFGQTFSSLLDGRLKGWIGWHERKNRTPESEVRMGRLFLQARS